MITAIGAVPAQMRTSKRPENEIHFRLELKKRRLRPEEDEHDDADARPRRNRTERGLTA